MSPELSATSLKCGPAGPKNPGRNTGRAFGVSNRPRTRQSEAGGRARPEKSGWRRARVRGQRSAEQAFPRHEGAGLSLGRCRPFVHSVLSARSCAVPNVSASGACGTPAGPSPERSRVAMVDYLRRMSGRRSAMRRVAMVDYLQRMSGRGIRWTAVRAQASHSHIAQNVRLSSIFHFEPARPVEAQP
jgi:hypothetical protein